MLLIIGKSDFSDKRKEEFFQGVAVPALLHGCTTWILSKHRVKNLDGNYTKMLCTVLRKSWLQNRTTASVRTLASHPIKHPSKTNKTYGALLEKQRRSHKRRFSMESDIYMRQCWSMGRDLHTSAMCGHWMQFGRPARNYGW